jgi:hypothetical protein
MRESLGSTVIGAIIRGIPEHHLGTEGQRAATTQPSDLDAAR